MGGKPSWIVHHEGSGRLLARARHGWLLYLNFDAWASSSGIKSPIEQLHCFTGVGEARKHMKICRTELQVQDASQKGLTWQNVAERDIRGSIWRSGGPMKLRLVSGEGKKRGRESEERL